MNVEIDKFHILALAGDDRDLVSDILDEFYENGLELVEAIDSARADSNNNSVGANLHQLKGSSGMFGMSSLHALCKELEGDVTQLNDNEVSKLRECLLRSYQLATGVLLG